MLVEDSSYLLVLEGSLRFGVLPISLALTLVAFLERPTSASERVLVSLDFQTEGGLSCPSGSDFQRAIRAHLRWDPFRLVARRRIVIRIRANEGGLEGRVEWRDAKDQWEAERTFSSVTETCAEFSRTVALATAIQIQLFASIDEDIAAEPAKQAQSVEKPPRPAVETPVPSAPLSKAEFTVQRPPKEPRVALQVGAGVIRDVSNAPIFAVPRLVIILGRPSSWGLRLSLNGMGPQAAVKQFEGTAEIDRFVGTLELMRIFRPDHRVKPLVAFGVGVQRIHVHGISAMPALGAAHDGQVLSGVLSAGGGIAFALGARVCLVMEVDALVFRPKGAVKIGSSPTAAGLDGLAVLASGGVLARF